MDQIGEISGFGHNHQIKPQTSKGQPALKGISIKTFETLQATFKSLAETEKKTLGNKYPLRKRAKKLPHPPFKKNVQGPFVPQKGLLK